MNDNDNRSLCVWYLDCAVKDMMVAGLDVHDIPTAESWVIDIQSAIQRAQEVERMSSDD